MAKKDKIIDVMSTLRQAGKYFLNSDYDLIWKGTYASALNEWNDSVESITIPGKTIQTSETRTANSVTAKLATDVTFEDMDITWRLDDDLGAYRALDTWMAAAKSIDNKGTITTGYWDDYCYRQQLLVSGGVSKKSMFLIDGLYPTALQSIQFSAEGGEYMKLTCTFTCYLVVSQDYA